MVASGSVLVVCTGNVCRSPYIERRLRQELAGTASTSRAPAPVRSWAVTWMPGRARLLDRAGADAAGFAARAAHRRARGVGRPRGHGCPRAPERRGPAAPARRCAGSSTLRDLADLLDGCQPGRRRVGRRQRLLGPTGGGRGRRPAGGRAGAPGRRRRHRPDRWPRSRLRADGRGGRGGPGARGRGRCAARLSCAATEAARPVRDRSDDARPACARGRRGLVLGGGLVAVAAVVVRRPWPAPG